MNKYGKAVSEVYRDSSNFVLLGLTGRTGSGCSTAAKILTEREMPLPEASQMFCSSNEQRKYRIARKFIKANWNPFISIQVRTVLSSFLLELDFEEFAGFVGVALGKSIDEVTMKLSSFKSAYDDKHLLVATYKALEENSPEEQDHKINQAWSIYFETLPAFAEEIKKLCRIALMLMPT